MALQAEIERKLTGRMTMASRAFLWLAAAGVVAAFAAVAYTQRWFTPTIDLYFYAPTATGLTRGIAVKLVGFKVGSLDEVALVGELRVRGKFSMDRRYRDSVGKDARVRLAKEGLVGAYVLELITGQGDSGPVERGAVLAFDRELDYSAAIESLVERAGPMFDEVRSITMRLNDPQGNLQNAIKHLNEATVEFVATAKGLQQLVADGSTLVRGMPGRIDPVLGDLRRSLARAEALLGDTQRSLARADSVLQQGGEALPSMIDDTRRSLRNLRAASESLNSALAQDVPRLLNRGEATLDDAGELIDGVRRAWPVRTLLPAPAEKVIELESADGAGYAGTATPAR